MRHNEEQRRLEDEEERMTRGPTYEGQKGQSLMEPIANTTTQPEPTHKMII
jgi:cell division protein FtsN